MKDMKDKRWVQRAYEKDKQSTDDNKTHYMGMSKAGDQYIVYPHVREQEDGSLKELNNHEAVGEAYKNRDALVYNNEKDAMKASIYGYKKAGNFPKQVVKEARKDWKKVKKNRRYE
jgi:hypothetical protein